MGIHFLNGTIGDDGVGFVPTTGTICEIAYSPWSELSSKTLSKKIENDLVNVFLGDKTALMSFCAIIKSAMINGRLEAPLVLVKNDTPYHYCDFLSTFVRKAFGENSINASMKMNIFKRKVNMMIHEPSKTIKGPPCIYFKNKSPQPEPSRPMNIFLYTNPTSCMLHDGLEQALLSFIFRE